MVTRSGTCNAPSGGRYLRAFLPSSWKVSLFEGYDRKVSETLALARCLDGREGHGLGAVLRRSTVLLGLMGAVTAASAQEIPPDSAPRGEVLGTVLDAASGTPLRGAIVLLEPEPGGAVAPVAARSPFWATGLTATTNASGRYRFTRIIPGTYRLIVRRLGYRPTVLAVELRRAVRLRVSVGLTVRPILLEPEEVVAPATLFASASTFGERGDRYRLDTELYRQRTFVESDVHVLTRADVAEAVTLGETDLFRALQRLPGVTTRDDFTAELWTRGAPWSQTRIYFDGLPLFNPLHTAGVFSGINPDAVGAAFFYTGTRSVALGEGAAGVIDLSSRAGSGQRVGGGVELSAVSGRLTLDGGFGKGRGGWMLAGRRSYVDLLTSAFTDSAGQIPYAFLDLTGRADIPVGATSTLELSGMWGRDDVRGSVRNLLRQNQGYWGNAVARATLAARLGDLYTRHTIGVSRYAAQIGAERPNFERQAILDLAPAQEIAVRYLPTGNAITYVAYRSRFEPVSGSAAWAAGLDVSVQDQRYDGPVPRPYPVAFRVDSLRFSDRRSHLAVWGERRLVRGPVRIEGGLRAEVTGQVVNVGRVALAPRISARYAPSPRAAITVGAGRSYQYAQAIAPAGPGVGPQLYLMEVWVLANDTLPAVRSDIATLGGEGWLGDGWLGAVNLYARRATGVMVPDPFPGPADVQRPVYATATNRALGVEVSLRHLVGRITGSLSYSHGSSRLTVGTLSYPAPTERRHALDLTGMIRTSAALRLGAAVTVASGAPFSRYFVTVLPCDVRAQACPDTVVLGTTRLEAPGQGRAPTYVAVDVLADWTRVFSGWSLSAFVQLRNAIDRRGAVTYAGSYDACPIGAEDVRVPRPGVCDLFDRGLPFLPLVGLSVRF